MLMTATARRCSMSSRSSRRRCTSVTAGSAPPSSGPRPTENGGYSAWCTRPGRLHGGNRPEHCCAAAYWRQEFTQRGSSVSKHAPTCSCAMEPLRSSTSRAATSCASLGGAAGGSGSGTEVMPRYCDGRDGRALAALPTLQKYAGHFRITKSCVTTSKQQSHLNSLRLQAPDTHAQLSSPTRMEHRRAHERRKSSEAKTFLIVM